MDPHIEELRRHIRQHSVTIIVGAGVSIGATQGSPAASWPGLLESGVQACLQLGRQLPDGWAERMRGAIGSQDMDELLSAAEQIIRKLGGPDGLDYRQWLRCTIGSLRAKSPGVLRALLGLGCPIVTTNYDALLETESGLGAVTWLDKQAMHEVIIGRRPGIIHLHGYWDQPESLVFGMRSYEQILSNEHTQSLIHALWATRSLLFVGCGAGLADPNFSKLLEWASRVLAHSPLQHFRLARADEADSFQAQHHPGDRVSILSYGADHSDLGPFLERLRPGVWPPRADGRLRSLAEVITPPLPAVVTAQPGLETARREVSVALRALKEAMVALDEERGRIAILSEQLAQETEQRAELIRHLTQIPQIAKDLTKQELRHLLTNIAHAAEESLLDERSAQLRVQQALRRAGWEADASLLSHCRGSRPQPHRNLAIADWPLPGGGVGYALFVGTEKVAVIAPGVAPRVLAAALNDLRESCRGSDVVLLFAANGRTNNWQAMQGGIWFLDTRASAAPRELSGFYTPDGLMWLLQRDPQQVECRQLALPVDGLALRPYQLAAVRATEQALLGGRRRCLVVMASGTGKQITCASLLLRLVASGMCRRILYLADRKVLVEQFRDIAADSRVGNGRSLNAILHVTDLRDLMRSDFVGVELSTVQAFTARWEELRLADISVPVDRFDCVVLDDCVRVDRSSHTERVGSLMHGPSSGGSANSTMFEHFDAIQIGLTSEVGIHETQEFGPPVFWYGVQEAIADGYLVPPEPPIRIGPLASRLSPRSAIAGESDNNLLSAKRTLAAFRGEDGRSADTLEEFQFPSLGESIALCRELSPYLAPNQRGKTLVFCASVDHARRIADLLQQELLRTYGPEAEGVVTLVCASSADPTDLVRAFKNQRLPSIAVTVELLATGIDIPEIMNLVFLRPIHSRQRFSRMLARAARQCPELEKRSFRVFDAVGVSDLFFDFFIRKNSS